VLQSSEITLKENKNSFSLFDVYKVPMTSIMELYCVTT